jgi:hypothetical protein
MDCEYNVKVTCRSSTANIRVCLFQKSRKWYDARFQVWTVAPVVWALKPVAKGYEVHFRWMNTYSVYCKRDGEGGEDIIKVDADPRDAKRNSFDISYAGGLYYINASAERRLDKSIHVQADELLVLQPKVYVGFCMGGEPVCQQSLSPNVLHSFNAETEYFLLAGFYKKGAELNDSDLGMGFPCNLSEKMPSKAFMLMEDNTWEVDY